MAPAVELPRMSVTVARFALAGAVGAGLHFPVTPPKIEDAAKLSRADELEGFRGTQQTPLDVP